MSNAVSLIEALPGLKLVSPYPAALIEDAEALIVSDIHLGIESKLASKGTLVPDSVFRSTLDSVLIPARETGCKSVYILGDLKHESGKPKESDWWAVRRFVRELRDIGAEPKLVTGNHDLRITPMLRELGVPYFRDYSLVDGFVLAHGHKKIRKFARVDSKLVSPKAIVIGHEHPAISFRNEFGGRREKFKAFLVLPRNNKNQPPLVVMPSVNPLAYGTEVSTSQEYLSPYLKERRRTIGRARPYVLEVGEVLLPFPEISKLRDLT